MSLALISVISLMAAIVISCVSTLNIGTLAFAMALVIGHYIGGMKIDDLIKGYPTSLLVMLAGTTFLFSIAQVNGTLEKVAKYAIKAVRGNTALLPIVLFFVALIMGAAGPGPTVAAALMAPTVMLLAKEMEVNPLLLAMVVGNGGHAGGMSPIAVGGVITTGLTAKLGLTGVSALIWYNNVLIHFLGAILAYFWFGGHKLWKSQSAAHKQMLASIVIEPFSRDQWITIAGLLAYICGVVFFKMDIGMGAFLIGTILTLLRVVNEEKAIKGMPWGAILMVTGVTVLISMMSKVGGIDLFAGLIAKLSTTGTITIVTGTIAGVISAFASTTGVILTTFIPMAPALLEKVGAPATELIPLISTIVACGFIVDMSPLSTSGAIYLANAHESQNRSKLFRDMLTWGLSMSIVGAVLCWLLFSVLGVP